MNIAREGMYLLGKDGLLYTDDYCSGEYTQYKEIPNDPDTYTESELREIVGSVATNQAGVLKPMLAKQADKVTNQKIYDKPWWASRKIDGRPKILMPSLNPINSGNPEMGILSED